MVEEHKDFEPVTSVDQESTDLSETNPNIDIEETKNKDLVGIKGWLIFVAFGRIITPISILYLLFVYLIPQFTNGTLDMLSKPGSEIFSPMWRSVIYMELGGNIINLILSILLLVLLFKKKRQFPKWFIITVIYTLLLSIADGVAMQMVQNSITYDLQLMPIEDVLKIVVSAAIWIPYMLISERVKNTFVN